MAKRSTILFWAGVSLVFIRTPYDEVTSQNDCIFIMAEPLRGVVKLYRLERRDPKNHLYLPFDFLIKNKEIISYRYFISEEKEGVF